MSMHEIFLERIVSLFSYPVSKYNFCFELCKIGLIVGLIIRRPSSKNLFRPKNGTRVIDGQKKCFKGKVQGSKDPTLVGIWVVYS